MNLKYILTVIFIGVFLNVSGQGKVVLGQYFQNLPAFSPALTGANDFLDIRTGLRKQWAGFDGAPTTSFISAYSPINRSKDRYKQNSLRTGQKQSKFNGNNKKTSSVKLALGGYILLDDQGPFNELEAMGSFAAHIEVMPGTYLSLGTSLGVTNSKIDLSEITVVDEINDATYLSLVNNGASNSFLNINGGVALYSDKFYVSYSGMQLTKFLLSGNEEINNNGASIRHHILGGYRFFVNEKLELIPNTFLRMEVGTPFFYELGIRARYYQNFWIGASFRNDNSYVGMLGFAFNDHINFGYAYEFKDSDFSNFNNTSHEVTLGFRLFNFKNYNSLW